MGGHGDVIHGRAMSKPQVLVFIDWYSPGFKAGGPVRSLVNMVDHLRDRIDFHIVTSDTEYTERTPYPRITTDRWTTLPGGEKIWYASKSRTNSEAWNRILGEKAWDNVYINGLYSRWFSIAPLRLLKGSNVRRVVAVRGMLASGMMKHGALKKRAFLAAMKLFSNYKHVEFQATNTEEAEDIKRWIARDAVVHLVPNLARKLIAAAPPPRDKKAGELRLISVARIAVEKNTLFAIECLKNAVGNITFDLYGPIYDEAYWKLCQQAIAQLPPNVQVNYKGVIHPEKVPALFAHFHALFMPSQGENFGHTMAEALAAGLPLLISDRTPWRGLEEKKAGWDLALDRQRFSDAIRYLAQMESTEFSRWTNGAASLAKNRNSPPDMVEKTCLLLTGA